MGCCAERSTWESKLDCIVVTDVGLRRYLWLDWPIISHKVKRLAKETFRIIKNATKEFHERSDKFSGLGWVIFDWLVIEVAVWRWDVRNYQVGLVRAIEDAVS